MSTSEIDIVVSSTGNFNFFTLDKIKKLDNNAVVGMSDTFYNGIDLAGQWSLTAWKNDNISTEKNVSSLRWSLCDRAVVVSTERTRPAVFTPKTSKGIWDSLKALSRVRTTVTVLHVAVDGVLAGSMWLSCVSGRKHVTSLRTPNTSGSCLLDNQASSHGTLFRCCLCMRKFVAICKMRLQKDCTVKTVCGTFTAKS